MAPSEGGAISIGQGALAGSAVLGLGALAYYGTGMSQEMGAVDKAVMWPQYVKDRVADTYLYFGGSLVATAGSAVAIYRSPKAFALVSRGGLLAMGVSIAAMIGSSMVARSIPYSPGLGAKQAAWLLHGRGRRCRSPHLSSWRTHSHQGGLVYGWDGGRPLHCGADCTL